LDVDQQPAVSMGLVTWRGDAQSKTKAEHEQFAAQQGTRNGARIQASAAAADVPEIKLLSPEGALGLPVGMGLSIGIKV
jgi:hypothetical protein